MRKKYFDAKKCEYAVKYSRELNKCLNEEFYCSDKVVIPPVGKNKICLCSQLREDVKVKK